MRELTLREIDTVSGGSVADATSVGAGAGGALGIVAFNTGAGAARGGAVGAALGFAWGAGWATGTEIYRCHEYLRYNVH
jgi:hypothetical protein